MSSENIAPRSPNKAPEAPTEMLFIKRRAERTEPPKPDSRYITPMRTAWHKKFVMLRTTKRTFTKYRELDVYLPFPTSNFELALNIITCVFDM